MESSSSLVFLIFLLWTGIAMHPAVSLTLAVEVENRGEDHSRKRHGGAPATLCVPLLQSGNNYQNKWQSLHGNGDGKIF